VARRKILVGDVVDYHSVIGQEITSRGHIVLHLYPEPNNFGCDCASISGKPGVVAIRALTHTKRVKIPAHVRNTVMDGQLEIDHNRGVIYFHDGKTGTTQLRICGVWKPIPKGRALDIAIYRQVCNWT
jgi:hypothetical protein